jgi:hypothetical protein
MRKVFWDDPYQDRLVTRVTSVAGDQVQLDETIVFCFAGGQESDQGWVNGMPILDSRRKQPLPKGRSFPLHEEGPHARIQDGLQRPLPDWKVWQTWLCSDSR